MAKQIVIASGKGGVGKSSVSAGLAMALKQSGLRVLLVDCDIGLRSLDLILGAGADMLFHWGDVIQKRCKASQAVTETAAGLPLLCAPSDFEAAYTPEAMRNLMQSYESSYDFILFDSPAGIGLGLELAAASTDFGILVATPDEVCVRSGQIAADVLARMGVKDSRLIINRFDSKSVSKGKLLNIDEVIDLTHLRLLGVVPMDPSVSFGMSRGRKMEEKTKAMRAFERIAGRLNGKHILLEID
ncbi:MAG TPA: septum site-determining protein MinD [Ruminococcaceae bacterium]|nr:septum site-determining protein MinD [Oscillospiraceae bacterium]